ncbi:MAG: non-canonical purine NTP pyrophosphatase, partial [Gammaproteobacteria bacterium]|nr:non-canonical purine NTP pyrophosphatase [Gammaproteobacteria bacterium]
IDDSGRTSAQLPAEQKNVLSHRARATAQLLAALGALQSRG